jgi:hypothetical protein
VKKVYIGVILTRNPIMQSITVPLIEETDDRRGWFVEVDTCGPHSYRYILVEQLDHANRTYPSGLLPYPEYYIALRFAIAQMKALRQEQGLL